MRTCPGGRDFVAIFSYDKRPDKLFDREYIDMVRSFRQDAATS